MQSPEGIRAFVCGLKAKLESLLGGAPAPADVRSVVRVAHAIAKVTLSRRIQSEPLVKFHGLDYNDLAYDCIADLFSRDDRGRYVALATYFTAFEFSSLTDEDVFFHIQRLVLRNVKQGVYRLYHQMDPQLGKILRNIKLSVQTLGLFREFDRLGDSCLAPASVDTLEHLPLMKTEELTYALLNTASGNEFVPELLSKTHRILCEQAERSRIVTLISLALAIRAFHEQKSVPRLVEQSDGTDDVAIDSREAIRIACGELRARAEARYVRRGKVSPAMMETYFDVIEQGLHQRFVDHDGAEFQISETFLKLSPGISLVEYRKSHRSRLEYLARLTTKRVVQILRNGRYVEGSILPGIDIPGISAKWHAV